MIDKKSIVDGETKTSIEDLINTINTNKKFAKLIIYSLNLLKSYLVLQNPLQASQNSIKIIECM